MRISTLVPKLLLLNDNGIEEALKNGSIKVDGKLDADQIQPASLDIRIGRVKLYDHEAMKLTAQHFNQQAKFDAEPTDGFAKVTEDAEGNHVDIPTASFVEIFFHESISYDHNKYFTTVDLRSSRGRMGLSLASRLVESSVEGSYVRLWNFNPNTIRLYSNDKFVQLFFHPRSYKVPTDGYVVTDLDEVDSIAKKLGEIKTYGPYLVFNLGEHLLKFKKDIGVIDTNKKYHDDELYQRYDTSKKVSILPGEAVIAQLAPRLNLPADIGIQLLHKIPYAQNPGFLTPDPSMAFVEGCVVNAGWVDPGYNGNVTAHPLRRKFPANLANGDAIALGLIYRYTRPVKRPYGSSALKSHYQNSTGDGAKS